ncbi:MAG: LysM peptidoglycan-binding domain-containing protein [Treponemataceae bacterium]
MKNILKFAMLAVLSLLLVTSCESKPDPEPTPPPEPVVVEEPTPQPEVVEEPVEKPVLSVNYTEYTVVKGDTLSQIAERFYGSKDKAYFFPIIIGYTLDSFSAVDVGSDSIKVQFADPDVIEPGMVIRVPNFDEFMASPVHVNLVKPLFEKIAQQYEGKGRSGVAKLLRERAERLGANY